MDLIEARQLACRLIAPLDTEEVRLEEALGRVLAENAVADRNLPGESRSRLDGFALRSIDTRNAAPGTPTLLAIIPGRVAAGHISTAAIGQGECLRILTGAPLPPGTDAVVPQEEAAVRGGTLVLEQPYFVASGVSPPGEDVRCGDLVVSSGVVLNPTRLALIAALGNEWITVYRQPRVALLATGDEVRPLGALREGPYTTCNNMLLLAWLTQLKGGKSLPLGVVADDPRTIANQLREAAADLLITTGGRGTGDRDFLAEVWRHLGIQVIFDGINLIPGRNAALGNKDGRMFLGLPGNPWAAQTAFEQLASPLLRLWQGLRGLVPTPLPAILHSGVTGKPGFFRVIRGSLDLGATPPRFHPATARKASVFSRIGDCFAYILLEPHVVEVAAGSEVQVQLSDSPLLASPLLKGTGFPCSD